MIKEIVSFILFWFSLYIFSGCMVSQDDFMNNSCPGSCTTIKGTFTTSGGTTAIADLPIEITWIKRTGLFGGTSRRKSITKTNANGFYELTFLIRDDELIEGYYKVEARVNKKEYLVYENAPHGFSLSDLKRDTTVIRNYVVPRKAFIQLAISNPEAIHLSNNDYFGTAFISNWGVNGQENNGTWISWNNYKANETSTIEVAADQPLIIQTNKTKNAVKTETYDTLQLQPNQQISYTVTF